MLRAIDDSHPAATKNLLDFILANPLRSFRYGRVLAWSIGQEASRGDIQREVNFLTSVTTEVHGSRRALFANQFT